MKSKQQLLKFIYFYLASILLSPVLLGLAVAVGGSEGNVFSTILLPIACLPMFAIMLIAVWALIHAMWTMRKACNATTADELKALKLEIHYTLPLAFPLASIGITPVGIALAFILALLLFKWAKPIYDWPSMKTILLHRNGTTWKCTLLTWVNFLFFILASFYPILVVTIILLIAYLLYKVGLIDGFFNMIQDTMASAGTSGDSFRVCRNCAYYTGYSCARTGMGATPNESCSDFTT